jgi:membrane protease YdiL (CAAX protease family)
MSTSFAPTARVVTSPARQAPASVVIPQYGVGRILAVWAAAALPMGALAWLVAPALKASFAGTGSVQMAKALIVCFAAGLIWQFVLVVALLRREQGTLRWSTTREALWLRSPRSPRSGRVGGRIWLVLVPLIVAATFIDGVPFVNGPSNRDFGTFIGSHAGHAFLSGAWGWYALILVMLLFNTVLGEELLFRGFLLPRMNRAFGRGDWLANGVLFALYHLHEPWEMPSALLDSFIYAYPTKRYRSAWIGIAVHSASSVFFAIVLLTLVA